MPSILDVMFNNNTPQVLLKKTYDECYLKCSTALYFETKDNAEQALHMWRKALDKIHYHHLNRVSADYRARNETEKTLQEAIRKMENQCNERIGILHDQLRRKRADQERVRDAAKPSRPDLPPRAAAAAAAGAVNQAAAADQAAPANGPSRFGKIGQAVRKLTSRSRTPSPDEKTGLFRSLRPRGHGRKQQKQQHQQPESRPVVEHCDSGLAATQAATKAWVQNVARERGVSTSDSDPLTSRPISSRPISSGTTPPLNQPSSQESISAPQVSSEAPPMSGPLAAATLAMSRQSSSQSQAILQPSPIESAASSSRRPSDSTPYQWPVYRQPAATKTENQAPIPPPQQSRAGTETAKSGLPAGFGASSPADPTDLPATKPGKASAARAGQGSRPSGDEYAGNVVAMMPHQRSQREAAMAAAAATGSTTMPAAEAEAEAGASAAEQKQAAWKERVEQILENLPRGVDAEAAKQILNDIVEHGDEVRWDDVAGLEVAKAALKEAVVYPFLRPDLFKGLREPTRGMLLFGPPGTGKTMLARAVATESKSTFFSISSSSLTAKYLGESEKLVRALFGLAKALAPSIIFVDEIDSLLSARTDKDNEASRRIKTEFLIQWSDLSRAAAGRDAGEKGDAGRVLVLAATNTPWAIDEAARRRFVRRQYIPLPEGPVRGKQLRCLLGHQKHSLSGEDLDRLTSWTEDFSGSDITALAKDAAMGPLRALGEALLRMPMDQIRPIGIEDFEASLRKIRPSVDKAGLARFEDWAKNFGERGA